MKDSNSLVRPLWQGPLDIVGDVHGEIEALNNLLHHLGYDAEGSHPDRRRLVFAGDLVDRGPDTPQVLRTVMRLVDTGRAQAVLGNHELSILRGRRRTYNHWMFPGGDLNHPARQDQAVLPESERQGVLDFVGRLPIVLERDDLRVVHAAWDDDSVDRLREYSDAIEIFETEEKRLTEWLDANEIDDPVQRNLIHQNENPVKRVTSGPEERGCEPFVVEGRERWEVRTPWWQTYTGEPFVIFGHYSKTSPKTQNGGTGRPLFPRDPYESAGNTFSVDFAVGSRAEQRRKRELNPSSSLAAVRWPERAIMHEDGQLHAMKGRSAPLPDDPLLLPELRTRLLTDLSQVRKRQGLDTVAAANCPSPLDGVIKRAEIAKRRLQERLREQKDS